MFRCQATGKISKPRDRTLHLRVRGNLRMTHRAADSHLIARHGDVLHRADTRDIHQRRWLRKTKSHGRQQALPAPEIFGVVVLLEERHRCIGLVRPLIIE